MFIGMHIAMVARMSSPKERMHKLMHASACIVSALEIVIKDKGLEHLDIKKYVVACLIHNLKQARDIHEEGIFELIDDMPQEDIAVMEVGMGLNQNPRRN